MKLTNHELLLFVDDDYRENVFKSQAGRESAQNIIDDLNIQEVKKTWQQ